MKLVLSSLSPLNNSRREEATHDEEGEKRKVVGGIVQFTEWLLILFFTFRFSVHSIRSLNGSLHHIAAHRHVSENGEREEAVKKQEREGERRNSRVKLLCNVDHTHTTALLWVMHFTMQFNVSLFLLLLFAHEFCTVERERKKN